MPIDSSIYNMVGKFPQIEVPDPLERQTRLAQLKQLANQGQMTDMAMADAQAKRAREARAKELLTKNQGDVQKAAQEAAAAGDYETASEFQTLIKSRAQTDAVYQKSVSEAQEAYFKASKEERAAVQAGLEDLAKGIQWVEQGAPEELPARYARFVQAYPPQVREKYGMGPEYDPSIGGLIKARAQAWGDVSKADEFSGFHEAIGPEGKPGIFQVSKKGESRQIPGLKPIPPSRANMASISLGDVSSALADPAEEKIAQMVADGRLAAPPMSRNNPRNLRIIARADELKKGEGGLDATMFPTRQAAVKFFTTGKGADAFRQQETILHHTDVFQGIAKALDNGNIQLANKLGNEYGMKFAGSDKATNYRMAGQILSAEVGKYLGGGQSTQSERAELAELIPAFSSPDQFKGALNTLSSLVQGQRKSWQRQKDAALKGKPTEQEQVHTEPAKPPTKVNPADGKTYFLHSDGKYYSTKG